MKKMRFAFWALVAVLVVLPGKRCFAAQEQEPNDSIYNAQVISFGTEYSGKVQDIDFGDDEDYYKFSVHEGNFYKISIYNMVDLTDSDWYTMIVSLSTENNTEDEDSIMIGDYSDRSSLFRAKYSGYYYLHFGNTSYSSYSFRVEQYNPSGKKVKDTDGNTYKITGNRTLEFEKIASKQNSDFYFDTSQTFRSIDGIEILGSYDTCFKVTAIGSYAFKGSKITQINIPKEITKIGTGAFQNCKYLGDEEYMMGVVIHGKNVKIESKAFSGCKRLESIRILKTASVKSVKKNAFKGTKKGIQVEVPNVKKYKKIFKNAGFKKPKYSKSYI